MASTLGFKNEATKQFVYFSGNAYFSKWVFKE
jgi:hypothetical protein